MSLEPVECGDDAYATLFVCGNAIKPHCNRFENVCHCVSTRDSKRYLDGQESNCSGADEIGSGDITPNLYNAIVTHCGCSGES